MKTKGILIALAIFTSFNLFAGAISENGKNMPDSIKHRINIRVNQDNQVVLRAARLDDQKWVNLILKVYSNKGEMVFAESLHQKGGIYRGFDMTKLPAGKYTFEVYKKLKKVYVKEVVKSTELVPAQEGDYKMVVQEVK